MKADIARDEDGRAIGAWIATSVTVEEAEQVVLLKCSRRVWAPDLRRLWADIGHILEEIDRESKEFPDN